MPVISHSSLISRPLSLSSRFSRFPPKLSPSSSSISFPTSSSSKSLIRPMSWLGKLGFMSKTSSFSPDSPGAVIAQGPDTDVPAPGKQFAQFGAGCFWGAELAFQRVPGVTKTEVGFSQGYVDEPRYEDVCTGMTNHAEIVRVQFDPAECKYEDLLKVFWRRVDPTQVNRQGNDVGSHYRSGVYYYTGEQEQAAKESFEALQRSMSRKIATELLPAKKFYRAEEYHQQYLAKGGRFGLSQSAEKGCSDPIRCYG